MSLNIVDWEGEPSDPQISGGASEIRRLNATYKQNPRKTTAKKA